MKVLPISFDSLGVRSMATCIETDDALIFVDPGVSLAPLRYGLEPHPIELEKMDKYWEIITEKAKESDVIIVTHYHYDHHNPWENIDIYKGKKVFIKHPRENINYSQLKRAAFFLDRIRELPREIEIADGREFQIGDTKIKFSEPVFHGTNKRLGYVVEVLVDDGDKRFLYSSDVEGPSLDNQTQFILESMPNIAIIDGPMTYMLGYRYSYASFEHSKQNLSKIIEKCPLDTLILDHHFLRDLNYRERISDLCEIAEKNKCSLITAAEYLNTPIDMLEARRKELYERHPVENSSRKPTGVFE